VPRELPDGDIEVHTFTVDSNGILYGGDNQYGRTQKVRAEAWSRPEAAHQPAWTGK
jgi:hypothetical protein